MPTETDLCNDSLSQIGAARITGIDDGTVNANHCLTFLGPLRDARIRSHHWNFAVTRTELAQDAAAPAFEFAFSYTLPPDCLKVIEYNGANLDTSNLSLFEAATVFRFKIEAGKVLTNDGVVKIVYLARVTNPTLWDPLFYQGLAAELASKLATAIPKDPKLSLSLLEKAEHLYAIARAVDGQEGSVERFRVDALTWGR